MIAAPDVYLVIISSGKDAFYEISDFKSRFVEVASNNNKLQSG